MGNSGWCISKEVDYQASEAYRSRNSEFKVKVVPEVEKDTKMNVALRTNIAIEELKSPDNEAQQVSHRYKNRNDDEFSYLSRCRR